MSQTGLEVFDKTLQKTHGWLNDIMRELNLEDRQRAYDALRATLHALRNRMPVGEAVHLGAQMPLLVRGIYFEGFHPRPMGTKKHRDEFLMEIEGQLPAAMQGHGEAVARAVFQVLAQRVSEGEIAQVVHMLPEDMLDLWPSTANQG